MKYTFDACQTITRNVIATKLQLSANCPKKSTIIAGYDYFNTGREVLLHSPNNGLIPEKWWPRFKQLYPSPENESYCGVECVYVGRTPGSLERNFRPSDIILANQLQIPKSEWDTGKRAPDVIDEHKDSVVSRWIELVKADPHLADVSLSEAERRDHVPALLDEAVARACRHRVNVEERQKAAERHGTLRYHQGYSIPMLILEARLLHDVVAECIRDHFGEVDLSNLATDMATMFDTLMAELEESARAYMKQYEWHAGKNKSGSPSGN